MDREKLKINKSGLISSWRWNALVDLVFSGFITSFAGGGYWRANGGTALWSRGEASSDSAALSPFDAIMTAVGDPVTSYTFKVWPGLIAGAMPTNMFATLSVNASGTYYLTATCTTDGRQVSSSSLSVDSSPSALPAPAIGTAASTVKFTVGVFVDGTHFNIWKRNINVSSREVFREDKSSPGPLELPYQSWWGWQVS